VIVFIVSRYYMRLVEKRLLEIFLEGKHVPKIMWISVLKKL